MEGIFTQFLRVLCELCAASAAYVKVVWRAGSEEVPVADSWFLRGADCVSAAAENGMRQIPMFSKEERAGLADARRSNGRPAPWTDAPFIDTGAAGSCIDRNGSVDRCFEPAPIEVSPRWSLQFDPGRRGCRFEGSIGDFSVTLRVALPPGGEGLLHRHLRHTGALLDLLEEVIELGGLSHQGGCAFGDGAALPLSPPLLGESKEIREVRETLRIAACCDIPLLVEGESGTGKEIVARNAHSIGPRRSNPLVIINCLEVPRSLLQSELFGHLKGSFTGASSDRIGLVESAAGGTLFLDEIGEMPTSLQAVLLRVLQEKEVRRIGESKRRRVDVRFVFATNRDLSELVEKGRFRRDLFYRICGIRIRLPSLRDRREDIPVLARHFLELAARESGEPVPRVTARALGRMLSYEWPGNVRELKNEMERAMALHPGTRHIREEMFSPPIRACAGKQCPGGRETLPEAVRRLEMGMIEEALERFDGNRTRAAGHLGITRQGLLKKLRRYRGATGPREPG
jgi:DNA-binding NtrC family response regulator